MGLVKMAIYPPQILPARTEISNGFQDTFIPLSLNQNSINRFQTNMYDTRFVLRKLSYGLGKMFADVTGFPFDRPISITVSERPRCKIHRLQEMVVSTTLTDPDHLASNNTGETSVRVSVAGDQFIKLVRRILDIVQAEMSPGCFKIYK